MRLFISLLTVINNHIKNNYQLTKQFITRCSNCDNEQCKITKEFFIDQANNIKKDLNKNHNIN